ncbi:coiled-coil domain-containing protein [Brassicibacter mesophilus]|uniref:coiled-coil domain-containing protein n=1 Tax=Brassicibacter mesophilus TaxID=745119 RepID=UPI003D1CEEFC
MKNIFKDDISQYNVLKLSDWIHKCRTSVKETEYNHLNNPNQEYERSVKSFCDDWLEYYQSKELYNNENYKKAIIANGSIRNTDGELKNRVVIQYESKGIKQEIDITDKLYNSLLKGDGSPKPKSLLDKYKKQLLDEVEEYYQLFSDLENWENHRKKIKELINYRIKYIVTPISVDIPDKNILLELDIDEIESLINSEELIIFEPLIEPNEEEKQTLLNHLMKYDITKQSYYDYINGLEKRFEKKLFINLGFYFSLSLDLLESLLNIHGYTIKKSKQRRDILIKRCIEAGFEARYTNIYLTKEELYPLYKRDLNRKESLSTINDYINGSSKVSKSEYQKAIKQAINKINRFLHRKHNSIKLKEEKLNNINADYKSLESKIKTLDDEYYKIESQINDFETERPKEYKKMIMELKNTMSSIEKEKALLNNELKKISKKKELLNDQIEKIKIGPYSSKDFLNYEVKKYNQTSLETVTLKVIEDIKADLEERLIKVY